MQIATSTSLKFKQIPGFTAHEMFHVLMQSFNLKHLSHFSQSFTRMLQTNIKFVSLYSTSQYDILIVVIYILIYIRAYVVVWAVKEVIVVRRTVIMDIQKN